MLYTQEAIERRMIGPMGHPIEVSVEDIGSMFLRGQIQLGDCVGVVNGERGPLNWMIRHVQQKALLDFDGFPFGKKEAKAYAAFTHIAMIIGADTIGEAFWPRVRRRAISDLRGATIAIRRPKGISGLQGVEMVDAFRHDISFGAKYPLKELLYYYFRWYRKTTLHHKFADIFLKSRKYDVCSGRYIYWSREACIQEAYIDPPEAYYPALLIWEPRWMMDIHFLKVT